MGLVAGIFVGVCVLVALDVCWNLYKGFEVCLNLGLDSCWHLCGDVF